jgi:predicted PurR-regulated permease PerM
LALLLILKIRCFTTGRLRGVNGLVPMIGPWLGNAVGVVVTLATAPEKIIWVVGGYLVIQLLENNLLVPKIQGTQMGLHPAYIMILVLRLTLPEYWGLSSSCR